MNPRRHDFDGHGEAPISLSCGNNGDAVVSPIASKQKEIPHKDLPSAERSTSVFVRHSFVVSAGRKTTWWSGTSACCAAVVLALIATNSARAESDEASAFGRTERGTGALVGIFYDLKQNQQRKPVPKSRENYPKILDQFLVAGFDEAILNKFFRAGRPLYTTQIVTGQIKADVAPKAFGVAGVVKPSYWLIHYKGQVVPPADGSYRFVGFADNVLVVAINGRVVLVSNLAGTELRTLGWKPSAVAEPKVAADPRSNYGDWVDLRADQPVDIDIMIGERPGGSFHATLLYQKQGETYPSNAKGEIILPLFQVAPFPMADTRFLTDRAPWKCID